MTSLYQFFYVCFKILEIFKFCKYVCKNFVCSLVSYMRTVFIYFQRELLLTAGESGIVSLWKPGQEHTEKLQNDLKVTIEVRIFAL